MHHVPIATALYSLKRFFVLQNIFLTELQTVNNTALFWPDTRLAFFIPAI